MQETILSLRDISKSYPGAGEVLKSISLDIKKGGIFALLGPSGSGKSTLMSIIAGTIRPDYGRIYLNGEDITDLPPYKRDITLIWQSLELFPHMTVRENILFPLRMKKVDKKVQEEKLKNMLKFVELEGLENRYPRELSGGQQQRVALARGLISEPTILLLDEPLSDLDRLLWERMLLDLKKLQREIGTTFIYVTHNQIEAMMLGDRIGIIKDGNLIQVGTPEEIYNNPKTAFVARFVGATNEFEGDVIEIQDQFLIIQSNLSPRPFITTRYDDQVKEGDRAVFFVRPEDITIGDEALTMENTIEGRIISTYFKGSMIDYIVRLPNNQDVLVSRRVSKVVLREGQKVVLGWNREFAKGFKK
jgi:ABC-type Fe3+/spermidine/putrescine transport system ATPase subunit